MVNEVMKFITSYDKEVGGAIEAECARQRRNLELIASENIVSEPVMMAMGTVLTNKYAEGYSGCLLYTSYTIKSRFSSAGAAGSIFMIPPYKTASASLMERLPPR